MGVPRPTSRQYSPHLEPGCGSRALSGVLALSFTTCAYDDDGKKQHGFHEEKLHQGHSACNG